MSQTTGALMPPFEIRCTHPYGYRVGQWAMCWGILKREDRDCYFVRFPDGETDLWVVSDPSEPYEFRRPGA